MSGMKQKFIEALKVERIVEEESWAENMSTVEFIDNKNHEYGSNFMRLDLVARFNQSFMVQRDNEYDIEAAKQYLARSMDSYMYGDIKEQLIEAIIILQHEVKTYPSKGIQLLDQLLDSLNS